MTVRTLISFVLWIVIMNSCVTPVCGFSFLNYMKTAKDRGGATLRNALPFGIIPDGPGVLQSNIRQLYSYMHEIPSIFDLKQRNAMIPTIGLSDNVMTPTWSNTLGMYSLDRSTLVPQYRQFAPRRPVENRDNYSRRNMQLQRNEGAPYRPAGSVALQYNENASTPKTTVTTNASFSTFKDEGIIITTEERSIITSQMPSVTERSSTTRYNSLYEEFVQSLDQLERKFTPITFNKLLSISPPERKGNGISFLQSGLFLHIALLALSTEVDFADMVQIDQCLEIDATTEEKTQMVKEVISMLPTSNIDLRFRWSNRLALAGGVNVSQQFVDGTAEEMQIHLHRFNGTETTAELANKLNKMVEEDSGGAMHDTFLEDELLPGLHSALLSTVYARGRWRTAPTLLNGTWPFHDARGGSERTARMFRINDLMRYASLDECDAEVVEVSYVTSGLTLLVLVPRSYSLRRLIDCTAAKSLTSFVERMYTTRVAVTLPLYTLRMTLLLPNKLETMGITRLIDTSGDDKTSIKLSHAVQRIMFWSEAGRNAYKDDGIEWDPEPNVTLVVNRPYIFYLRWKNITLLNGNFVL